MEPQRQFQPAGPEALERLGYIRVALGNDGQGAGKFDLCPWGNVSNSFRAALSYSKP
jgi:hypothetical protein